MKDRPPRYGMAHHTIRYWQDQAQRLSVYNGISMLKPLVHAATDPRAEPREIAHFAIMAAWTTDGASIARRLKGE